MENSFLYRVPFMWNSLPPQLRTITNLVSFKRNLENHLLDIQSQQEKFSMYDKIVTVLKNKGKGKFKEIVSKQIKFFLKCCLSHIEVITS